MVVEIGAQYCPKCRMRTDKPGPPPGYEHPLFLWTEKPWWFAENWHGKDYWLLEVVVLPSRIAVGLALTAYHYFVKLFLWYLGLIWIAVYLPWWAVRWPWNRNSPKWCSPAQLVEIVLGDY